MAVTVVCMYDGTIVILTPYSSIQRTLHHALLDQVLKSKKQVQSKLPFLLPTLFSFAFEGRATHNT